MGFVLLVGGYIQKNITSARRHVCHVPVGCKRLCNGFARLDLAEGHKGISCLRQRARDRQGRFGLSLCSNDGRLPLLFSLKGEGE